MVDAWKDAESRADGSKREAQSRVINRAIVRKGTALTVNDDKKWFTLDVKKTQSSHTAMWHEGIIYEAAKVQAGGLEDLMTAVRAGRVQVSGATTSWEGMTYHFPKVSSGTETRILASQGITSTHELSSKQFDDLEDAFEELLEAPGQAAALCG